MRCRPSMTGVQRLLFCNRDGCADVQGPPLPAKASSQTGSSWVWVLQAYPSASHILLQPVDCCAQCWCNPKSRHAVTLRKALDPSSWAAAALGPNALHP